MRASPSEAATASPPRALIAAQGGDAVGAGQAPPLRASGSAPTAAAPPGAVIEQAASEPRTRPGRPTGSHVQPAEPAAGRSLGVTTGLATTGTAATLPFTGLNLLLAALLGAALLGTGFGARRLVPAA